MSVADLLRPCFHTEHYIDQVEVVLGVRVDAKDALSFYLADPRHRVVSPNPFFDEAFYRSHYVDIASAVAAGQMLSGFHHYLVSGFREGRYPNAAMRARIARSTAAPRPVPQDEAEAQRIVATSLEARAFLAAFPGFRALDWLNAYGKFLEPELLAPRSANDLMRQEFDAAWYRENYAERFGLASSDPEELFAHYVSIGAPAGASPHARFDEEFYLAFYPDVARNVREGALRSGFEHYVLAGRAEGRLARYSLAEAAEAALPGVAVPRAFERIEALRAMRHRAAARRKPAGARRTLFALAPRLNPDIAFGGFKAFNELLLALEPWLARREMDLALILTESAAASIRYALYHWRGSPIGSLIERLPVYDFLDELPAIGPRDRFLAYSALDTLMARRLAARTDQPVVLSLIQEDEAIFHGHNTLHAIISEALARDVFPIYNSAALVAHLKANRRSIFAVKPDAELGPDYCFFEHVPTAMPLQSVESMRSRTERNCIVYARPEDHAARNLYELIEMALSELCEEGAFSPAWNFTGLGALRDYPGRRLGGGFCINLHAKMPEAEYGQLMREADLGISLMYAPHPSLLPFELAATGAVVVTNTFGVRTAEWLSAISANIIPCTPDLEGLKTAIRQALPRVEQFEERHARALRPNRRSWREVFDDSFLDRYLAPVID
ncbi:MAG: hypothetical protein RMK64_03740 [Rhodovarius sp.]|nr:hypothetical protein [Rhodovarius sp.]MDW8314062.1 hypothetical protein [Rhodovarius sp.]